MLLEHQYPYNKAIMASLVGVPNAGKSSLINHLLGFDLSAVTKLPQTTRNAFHCTLTVDHTEIVLIDTPGLHRSSKEINVRMNHQAIEGAEGADLNLILLDLGRNLKEQWEEFRGTFRSQESIRSWILFTKVDLFPLYSKDPDQKLIKDFFQHVQAENPEVKKYFVISAKTGENIHQLIGELCDSAQPGPHLYPNGEVSNKNERFFTTEYIREQAFNLLKEELPYELAVIIDEYRDVGSRDRDREGSSKIVSYISASILVNRPSQRAIVVGQKGQIIREIGLRARKKIEAMVGGQIHLNLHVKVSPRWFKNNFVLEELGLPRAPQSTRVWRKKL